jgi:hypothetical protein
MAGSAYTGQAGPYYDYIDMICIHSYDSIKTGMDIDRVVFALKK